MPEVGEYDDVGSGFAQELTETRSNRSIHRTIVKCVNFEKSILIYENRVLVGGGATLVDYRSDSDSCRLKVLDREAAEFIVTEQSKKVDLCAGCSQMLSDNACPSHEVLQRFKEHAHRRCLGLPADH